MHGGTGSIVFKKLQPRGFVVGIFGRETQCFAQQAARTLRCHGTQLLVGQVIHAAAGALMIGSRDQVGGGIGERAVEVEQNESGHLRQAIR